MSSTDINPSLARMTGWLGRAAKFYLRLKRPQVVAVAGSVGKTTTKIVIGQLLAGQKRVSFMDESYNYGIGLYLSIFEQKVPARLTSPLAWLVVWAKVFFHFFRSWPEIIVLEYGIDHTDEMDKFVAFARPDIAILTAVTPEHMEFLHDIETVAREETKILGAARKRAFVNENDIEPRFIPKLENLEFYGTGKRSKHTYTIKKIDAKGVLVDFQLGSESIQGVRLQFISDHLVRQVCGAAAVALDAGTSIDSLKHTLPLLEATPGRMRVFEGANHSILIDDSANFSPTAGVRALQTLKSLEAKRHIAVLGNMHELGDYEAVGFQTVSEELNDIDLLILVGPLAKKFFGKFAKRYGFEADKNMFFFEDSLSAGNWLRPQLKSGDAVLVKGPFGGFYLEECTKLLLANPSDSQYLTRQSKFWLRKKRVHFGRAV